MKNIKILLILFNFFLLSCNFNQTQESSKTDIVIEEVKNNVQEITISASLGINTDSIKFKGISLHTSRKLILKNLGKPDKIIEPKYDCGAYSEAWQEMKFYQYFYGEMNFIVDEENDAVIEQLYFKNNNTIKINNVFLDKSFTFKEVINALEIEPKENYDETIIFLIPIPSFDENYLLKFENGKLSKFEINTSC